MSSSTVTRPVTGLPEYAGEGIYLHIRGERYIDCASGTFNVSLGYSALSSSAVVQMAVPLMQELADETGVAV